MAGAVFFSTDGADPTRTSKTGSSVARNGEPEGELGLVRRQDFDWHDQTGAPSDPQAGNIPGGNRYVIRFADFNNGSSDDFLPTVGTWSVQGGADEVTPSVLLNLSATVPGQSVAAVGFVYNAVVVDGQAGLFTRAGESKAIAPFTTLAPGNPPCGLPASAAPRACARGTL